MKLSPHKFAQYRTHHEIDVDADVDKEFWPIIGIMSTLWALWTGVVHLVDWLTVDAIVWYVEPFTVGPFLFLLIMKEKFDSLNPLHWWPMLWGYQVKLPDEERITIRPLDTADIMLKYGGRYNVHIVDYEHIKFRRQKDAVIYALRNF